MSGRCCQCFEQIASLSQRTQCQACKLFVHVDCLDLSEDEKRLVTLVRSNNIKIFCNRCHVSITAISDVRVMINELKTSFDERLNKIEDLIKSNVSNSPIDKDSIINESVERALRAANIIIYNVPEFTDSGDSNSVDDVAHVNDVLEICDPSVAVSPDNIQRIGKRQKDKVRPIKVTLRNCSQALLCLKNKKKLLHSKKFTKIVISDDKTVQQLSNLRALRDELKTRMDNGEKNITIKYINKTPQITEIKN